MVVAQPQLHVVAYPLQVPAGDEHAELGSLAAQVAGRRRHACRSRSMPSRLNGVGEMKYSGTVLVWKNARTSEMPCSERRG